VNSGAGDEPARQACFVALGKGRRTFAQLACRLTFVALLSGVLLLAVGCAPQSPARYREVPGFDARFERLETITLLPPRVAVYKRTAGGVDEEVLEWSAQARERLAAAVRERADRLGHLRFVPFEGPAAPLAESSANVSERTIRDETWELFEAVVRAIRLHTYGGPQLFAQRRTAFDYTLGSEAGELVAGSGADAVLLVVAFDHVETAGREAVRAAGVVMAAILGVGYVPPPSPAVVTIALVEAGSGDILWFNQVASPYADLRDRSSDNELVELALRGLDGG
jgi:hypothetical protein